MRAGIDEQMHFPQRFLAGGAGLLLQHLHQFLQPVIHQTRSASRPPSSPALPADRIYAFTRSANFSPLTFSNSVTTPWISASGRGGQPATYTSTGTTSSTPCTMA